MDKPYMTEQVIKFSDGTETVIRYKPNGDQAAIESASDELVASHESMEDSSVAGTDIEMELSDVESSEYIDEETVD